MAGVTGLLVVVGIGIWQHFHERIEAAIAAAIDDYLRSRVETEAFLQSSGRIRIAIGELDYGFFSGELSIYDVSVQMYDSTGHIHISMAIDSTDVTELRPWDILWDEGISIGAIDVRGVRVRRAIDEAILRENSPGEFHTSTPTQAQKATLRENSPGEFDPSSLTRNTHGAHESASSLQLPQLPSADSILSALAATILPMEIIPLNIEHISMNTISWVDFQRVDSSVTFRFDGAKLDIKAVAVDTDATTPLVGDVSLHVQSMSRQLRANTFVHAESIGISSKRLDSSLTFRHVKYIVDSLISYEARDVAFAYKQQRLTVGSFGMHPINDDLDHVQRVPKGSDRIVLLGNRLVLDGIDLTLLSDGSAIHANAITVGRLDIDILSDKRPVERRRRQRQPTPQLWQLIRQLPFRLDVGAVRLRGVGIKYSEWTTSPTTTATLDWSDGEYTITGVTTDTTASILDLRGSSTFLRTAHLDAHVRLDLRQRRHKLTATGAVKNLNLRNLNPFLIEAERVRITSGHCSVATFDIAVSGQLSRGSVRPDYTDLNLQLLRKDKSSGVLSGIASFLANWLVVRNDNTGMDARTGRASMKLPQDAALMQTIWFPIRKGVLDVVK